MDINEKEERYKFLLSKIDNEISKFKVKQTVLEQKLIDIKNNTKAITQESIPIALNANEQQNVYEFLKSHILELENLKSFLNQELNKIAKQKDLQNTLTQKYKNNIKVEQNQLGGFKIDYNDDEINKIAEDTIISKKLISTLKSNIFEKG